MIVGLVENWNITRSSLKPWGKKRRKRRRHLSFFASIGLDTPKRKHVRRQGCLESIGEWDNTLIMVISDNGADDGPVTFFPGMRRLPEGSGPKLGGRAVHDDSAN